MYVLITLLRAINVSQLLQPGEAPLETVRNITLNGDVEVSSRRHQTYAPIFTMKRRICMPAYNAVYSNLFLYSYDAVQLLARFCT